MATTLQSLVDSARVVLLEISVLVKPAPPIVAPQGTTGATTYTYAVVATNGTGHSQASVVGTTTTGNATLSATNYNLLNWTLVPKGTGYDIYRVSGGATQGKIGSTTAALTLNDTGLAGDSTTAPTTNTSGVTGTFWNDAELLDLANRGCHDAWRTVIDLHQEHFMTVDVTNVSLAASTATITGVPADTFRVLLIQPRDTTDTGTSRTLRFTPAKYNSPEFITALSQSALDPTSGGEIFYAIASAGSPVAAPTIYIAPQISAAVTLRFVYIPTLATLTASSNNPIPGESDHCIIAWIVAHAVSKEREDRSPDPNWMAVYRMERDSIAIASAPRQEQVQRRVRGVFDDMYSDGAGFSGDVYW